MSAPPQFETPRLLIRLPAPGDAPVLTRYALEEREFQSPFVPRRPDEYYTETFWQKRETGATVEFAEDKSLLMFLFDRLNPTEVLGRVNFSNIVRGGFHCCNLGYDLRQRVQGQGLMTEALPPAIAFVFDEMNIHRIQANYLPRNARSGRVLQRLGFVIEGRAREYLLINGLWEEHVLTSLTNPRWKAT